MLNIPNILTLLNLFFGSMAVYGVFYESPSVVIISFLLALLFDFFDGFAARKLDQTTPIGKELDSLADMVSFGAFPTFLIVETIERHTEMLEEPFYLFVFVLGCGTAFRLAKFNITEQTKGIFQGLPCPAMALFVFSLWINIDHLNIELLHTPLFFLIIAAALTILMNSNIPFLKFSFEAKFSISTILSIILFLIFIGFAIFDWKLAFLITSSLYIVFSFLLPIFR
ncbi:CDP-alcohol phosphatidyltransferase family protein [Membranihabitans maritimus]|uniref:CDP-alcohol phosphatidyltransferase family protein n=1 Tax=Membranihabitans maritimus TaxID=2904244 RepID=UPI001F01EFDE|nr:CDP-alcohol phosphatidyltransferase family protein [Membranihabitans maritimus]